MPQPHRVNPGFLQQQEKPEEAGTQILLETAAIQPVQSCSIVCVVSADIHAFGPVPHAFRKHVVLPSGAWHSTLL